MNDSKRPSESKSLSLTQSMCQTYDSLRNVSRRIVPGKHADVQSTTTMMMQPTPKLSVRRIVPRKHVDVQSITVMMMEPAPKTRQVVSWGKRDTYVAQNDTKSILPPTISQQNSTSTQKKEGNMLTKETHCPDLKPRTGRGFLTRKISLEKQEHISRVRAQQLYELLEASDQRDTGLNKMEQIEASTVKIFQRIKFRRQ